MVNGNSTKHSLCKKELLNWAILLLLALALVYSLMFSAVQLGVSFFVLSHGNMVRYSVSSSLVSPNLDGLVWGGAVLLVSVWLFSILFLSRCVGRRDALRALVPLVFVVLAGFGLFGFLPLVLATAALVVLCLVFSRLCFGVSYFSVVKRLVVGLVLVLVFVETAALVLFNFPVVLNLPAEASAVAVHWRLVELSLSNLAYPFLPYAYFLFIIMSVLAFLIQVVPPRLSENWRGGRLLQFMIRFRSEVESCKEQAVEPLSGHFPLAGALLVSSVVSSLFVVVTVLPWINPTYRLVSVDAPLYFQWIGHMRGIDINSAISWAFTRDRPICLIIFYFASFITSLLNLVQFLPALLIPLFCVVSVLVLRLFCPLREALIYTAFLAPFSVPALGLIYSGYFANLFALILVYVYFILLVRVLHAWSNSGCFALFGLSVLILFTHLATWFVFSASLFAFLFMEWRLATCNSILLQRFKTMATLVISSIAVALVCDFVRQMLSPFSSAGFVLYNAQANLGFPNTFFVLSGLQVTTNFYLGGIFGVQLLIFLSIVGFVFMLSFKSKISNLLVSWVFVANFSMLFGSSESVFNRLLFLLPSLILSGLGLSFVVRLGANWSKTSKTQKLGMEFLILIFVFLFLINFGLRYLSNINMT